MFKINYLQIDFKFVFIIALLLASSFKLSAQEENDKKELIPEMPVKVNKRVSPVTVRIICDSIKTGSGSIIGIAVTPSGGHALILTACHVISSNYDDVKSDPKLFPSLEYYNEIQVKIVSELTSVQAIILHEYIDPVNDLALIETEDPVSLNSVIRYTRSDQIQLGQKVAAFGFPETERLSQTVGVITREEGNFIIFNAKIAPGSSGGPLVDKYGRMIGVSMYTLEEEGYAFKTDLVEPIVDSWFKDVEIIKKRWRYSKYCTFWNRFTYKRNKYYTIGAVGIIGGVIFFILRDGKNDKTFGEPPPPPNY
jgi:S1-C subfamily serine protease